MEMGEEVESLVGISVLDVIEERSIDWPMIRGQSPTDLMSFEPEVQLLHELVGHEYTHTHIHIVELIRQHWL